MTMFVEMYHPALDNVRVECPLQAVDDYEARGWVLVDGSAPEPAAIDLTPSLGDLRYLKLADISASGTPTGDGLKAAFAPVGAAMLAAGPRWIFGGDSITNGTAASNFFYSYAPTALRMVGTLVARPDSIEAGTPGDTSAGLLARLPGQAAANGAQATVVMIGTNDAGSAVPLATTADNITAIVKAAKAYGPVVLCTIPPRGTSATAAIKTATAAINAWIRLFGPQLGCWIADANTVLADPATGDYAAGYDSGDGTHPTQAGHMAIAQVVAAAMKRATTRVDPYGLITSIGSGVITPDPLNARATVESSGWYEQPGGTGTAPTYSMVTDTSGRLPAGQWAQMDFDATASGGVRRLATDTTTGFAPGDTVLHCAHLQIEDVSGDWAANVAAGTADLNLNVLDQNAAGIADAQSVDGCPGIKNPDTGFYDIGPVAFPIQIPTGTTQLILWHSLVLPTGSHAKVRFGAIGLLNATTLGLQSVAGYGPSMINL